MSQNAALTTPRLMSWMAIALSVFAVVLWSLELEWVLAGGSERSTMTPLTSLLVVLVGSSMLLSGPARPDALGQGLICVALALSLWGIASYLDLVSLGPEQLLPDSARRQTATRFAGRSAPHTAVAIVMLSAALLVRRIKPYGFAAADIALVCTGLITFFALLGQLGESPLLYSVPGNEVTGLSLPTAVSLFLLCWSALSMQGDQGIAGIYRRGGVGAIMLATMMPAIFFAPLLIVAVEKWFLNVLHFDSSSVVHLGWAMLGAVLTTVTIVAVVFVDHHDRILKRQSAELERSNRELERYTYVASHDLRSPLRAIHNLSQWLSEDLREIAPAKSQSHLEMIGKRAARMEQLLIDLLRYSRIGHSTYQATEIDLESVAKHVFEMYASESNFKLELDLRVRQFVAFEPPLAMVLRNLVSNAVKHHPSGDGTIRVQTRDEGKCVRFSVTDNGDGIDPQYHEKIFELFQRLGGDNNDRQSGVGLAIVKKTVETCGGTICVINEEPKGVTFSFTWPKV